jgi:hypothetical protein
VRNLPGASGGEPPIVHLQSSFSSPYRRLLTTRPHYGTNWLPTHPRINHNHRTFPTRPSRTSPWIWPREFIWCASYVTRSPTRASPAYGGRTRAKTRPNDPTRRRNAQHGANASANDLTEGQQTVANPTQGRTTLNPRYHFRVNTTIDTIMPLSFTFGIRATTSPTKPVHCGTRCPICPI